MRLVHTLARGCLIVGALATTLMADDGGSTRGPWLETAGRSHILLVHFPLALVLTALLLELIAMLRGRLHSRTGVVCLRVAALVGLFAIVSGWVHANEGWDPMTYLMEIPAEDSGKEALFYHAWCGLVGTILAAILALVGARAIKRDHNSTLYHFGLVIAALSVGAAGHFGGDMVHGTNYVLAPVLRDHAEEPHQDDQVKDDDSEAEAAAPPSFAADILPIFADRCFKCHGPTADEGDLMIHNLDFMKDEEWESVVVPGSPDRSSMVRRIELAPGHRKVMPKKAEPLTKEQKLLIRRWVETGAN